MASATPKHQHLKVMVLCFALLCDFKFIIWIMLLPHNACTQMASREGGGGVFHTQNYLFFVVAQII